MGNVRGVDVETSVLAKPRPNDNSASVCVRYRLRQWDGEGIVKATRLAEGEGREVFSLFRLSGRHEVCPWIDGGHPHSAFRCKGTSKTIVS